MTRLNQSLLFITGTMLLMLPVSFAVENNTLENSIRSAIRSFVASHVKADSFQIQMDIPELPAMDPVHSNQTNILVDWKRSSDDLAGRVLIPVILIRRDHFNTTLYVTASIRLFHHVGVASRLLDRHHLLSREDFYVELRDVTDAAGRICSSNNLTGRRLKRIATAGSTITADMIETPPLICRGDRVRIRLHHSNLTITLTGFAREDGWLGDMIRVKNTQCRKEITARVKNASEVEVL